MFKSIALIVTSAAVATFSTVYAETSEHPGGGKSGASSAATPAAVHAKTSEFAPNDAQIAQIVLTADNVDVDYGKLAAKKTANPKVKEFAETMIRDHSAVNEKVHALAKKLNVTPEACDTSKSLKSDGQKELARLKTLEPAEFDKAYIDNEVSYHEAVIGALDTTLIPSAKNEELKSLLGSARPIFVAHLKHAKQIQKSFEK